MLKIMFEFKSFLSYLFVIYMFDIFGLKILIEKKNQTLIDNFIKNSFL